MDDEQRNLVKFTGVTLAVMLAFMAAIGGGMLLLYYLIVTNWR